MYIYLHALNTKRTILSLSIIFIATLTHTICIPCSCKAIRKSAMKIPTSFWKGKDNILIVNGQCSHIVLPKLFKEEKNKHISVPLMFFSPTYVTASSSGGCTWSGGKVGFLSKQIIWPATLQRKGLFNLWGLKGSADCPGCTLLKNVPWFCLF